MLLRPAAHIDLARHGRGDQSLAVFGQAGDGGFGLSQQSVDLGTLGIQIGSDGGLFWDWGIGYRDVQIFAGIQILDTSGLFDCRVI